MNIPKVGDIILRPVDVQIGPPLTDPVIGYIPGEVTLTVSEQGETMVRARFDPSINKFRVVSHHEADRGLAVFVVGDLPDEWTHLEIVRVGSSGNSVRAKAGAWGLDSLIQVYKGKGSPNKAVIQQVLRKVSENPALIPAELLVKNMTEQQIVDIVASWKTLHGEEQQ